MHTVGWKDYRLPSMTDCNFHKELNLRSNLRQLPLGTCTKKNLSEISEGAAVFSWAA